MKVSVIMPVYNGGKKLMRCLQSITGQTFRDFELIAVNDGSTDQSLEVLKDYQKQEPRLIVLSTENRGVSAARNLGLKHASGEYIRFADCDDVMPADSLALLVKQMEKHNAQLVIAPFAEVVAGSNVKRTQLPFETCLGKTAYGYCVRQYPRCFYYSVLWNKLYRREIIVKHRLSFDETLSWSEDFLFNIQYMPYIERAAVLDTPVYEYHHHAGGLTLKFVRTFIFHPVQTARMFHRLFADYRTACLSMGGFSVRDCLLFWKKTSGC